MKPLFAFLRKAVPYLLFWGWNLFMVSVLFFGLGPIVFAELLVAVFKGIVPWQFGAFALIITLIPLAGCTLAIATKLRSDPGRLLSMFYGIQVPLMVLALTRLFAIHELVASNALVLAVAAVGAAVTLRTLMHGPTERNPVLQGVRIAAASAFAALGAWSAAVTTLLVLPLFGYFVLSIPSWPGWLYDMLSSTPDPMVLIYLPMTLFWIGGLLATMVMFLVMPFAFLGSTARTWQLVHQAGVRRWGPSTWLLSVGTVLSLMLAFAVLARQPQGAVFSSVQNATNDRDRAVLVQDLPTLRQGLLNARLGNDRYFDGDPDGDGVHSFWRGVVGETLARAPQAVFVALLSPFQYHPVEAGSVSQSRRGRIRLPKDAQVASSLYAEVFDASMSRAERDALLASATHTWSWQNVQADLLSVGERKVRLHAQDVTTTVHGDVATVRIHDVWRNQGFVREEILLAFDLPQSAAVTGLWMGPDPRHEEAFSYIVAPRGAAQEVYEGEVKRRVDPALLEAVGPRQYRLRAFPLEPRDSRRDSLYDFGDEGPDLHIWMDVVVPVENGQVPLPVLNEARNAYWDGSESRTLDGQPAPSDRWLPGSIDVTPSPRERHEAVVSGFRVVAEPATAPLARLGTVDVVIDGSASMRSRRAELAESLAGLGAADVQVWCVREGALVRCDDFDANTALFWGHRSAGEHVIEWQQASQRQPDALIVLTDCGSYELAGDLHQDTGTLPPLWLVHLGGYPSAYPDWTLDRIQQSGGGIAATVPELLARMGDATIIDGWRFTVQPAEEGAATAPHAFDAIAARAAIRWLSMHSQSAGVAELDRLHTLAVDNHVISAWSSMIVLVDQRQKDLLKKASEDADRFEREGIDKEQFGDVSAVPEPGTWLLLLVGGALLLGRSRFGSRLYVQRGTHGVD